CIFFFQAEDGIRDFHVTGVQTCALPIFGGRGQHRLLFVVRRHDAAAPLEERLHRREPFFAEHELDTGGARRDLLRQIVDRRPERSEERRVGKEGGSRLWEEWAKKKNKIV